jgi:AAA+ superfamily predicted ATPase
MSAKDTFINQLREARWTSAGGGVYLKSDELQFTMDVAKETYTETHKMVYTWTRREGVRSLKDNAFADDTFTLYKALLFVQKIDGNAIVIFNNIDAEWEKADSLILETFRKILATNFYRTTSKRVQTVVTGLNAKIPHPLVEYFQVVETPLPDYEELETLLNSALADKGLEEYGYDLSATEEVRKNLINAALGLTRVEARIAFTKAKYDKKIDNKDVQLVAGLKAQKYTNKALEFYNTQLNLEDVGGLENLKTWLTKRKPLWETDPEVTHIPKPKGVLLTGLPGTGKSLSAKAISSAFGFPLLRLDVGSVFGKYYGESEAGMRSAIKAAEANAPCVLWIDEIEKGLGSNTDMGGQTRETVVGTLLTWMQERTKDIFVVATANNVDGIRPELLRKGRFDEIFFVDLPTDTERKAIFTVHLRKRVPDFDGDLKLLVEKSEGFVGAEIEQAIISAMIEAFGENRTVTADDICLALSNTTPLSVSQRTNLDMTRRWARDTQAVPASEGTVQLQRAGFKI